MNNRNPDVILLSSPTSVDDAPYLSGKELNRTVGHNSGNLAFIYAIDKQLGSSLPRMYRHDDPDAINSTPYSTAVIPCANHLGIHQDLGGEAENFSKIEKRMVSIGLGAQADANMKDLPDLPAGSVRWLKELSERSNGDAPNISVRGEYTLRLLEKYGVANKAVVLGCPSLHINPDRKLGEKIAEAAERPVRRVAVPSGHYRWRHLWSLEHSLIALVEQTHGSYIIQSPEEMFQGYRGEWDEIAPESKQLMAEAIGRSPEDEASVRAWYRAYSSAIFNVPAWMNYMRDFDFVIGPRIHGVMLALQAGVPAICIAHDSRTLELCQTMRVPYVRPGDLSEGVTLGNLRRLFDFDPSAFDERRKELREGYSRFLEGNNLNFEL
ncbi:polysaccharide pyruvyl transferase family protein [Brachybacterium sp. J153]|uniref:polysaccharide pyruvyl transferase family protein n=1 Tax=Brachybacterium sp. J153 TaxID=3116488 RepID=UPI002E785BE4|nr:polysaccharide pyruvyl transferase family protein [Brachybacterium sp. J153]MEE1617827.1 polysaccharide pyruvyl transferase family protein [Brachybacterium sp. J153]